MTVKKSMEPGAALNKSSGSTTILRRKRPRVAGKLPLKDLNQDCSDMHKLTVVRRLERRHKHLKERLHYTSHEPTNSIGYKDVHMSWLLDTPFVSLN